MLNDQFNPISLGLPIKIKSTKRVKGHYCEAIKEKKLEKETRSRKYLCWDKSEGNCECDIILKYDYLPLYCSKEVIQIFADLMV